MNGKELNLNEMVMITLGLITAEEEKPGGASGGW